MLSHGLWQREYGGDRHVVGRTMQLNAKTYEIVGVLPADFRFLWADIEAYLPAAFTPDDKADSRPAQQQLGNDRRCANRA